MPKHTTHWTHHKPRFTTPPASPPPDRSVNALLSRLRSQRLDGDEPRTFPPTTTPSVPPSLQTLLGAPLPPPPRPRIRPGVPRSRRIPGPPPPASWLVPDAQSEPEAADAHIAKRSLLPDLPVVNRGSLLDFTLRRLAREWEFHEVYDQHYLRDLAGPIKALLLHYIAVYAPRGITAYGLEVLGVREGVTHLDLSRSDIREVLGFFRRTGENEEGAVAEDWGEEGSAEDSEVTHLSLANPVRRDVNALCRLLEALPGVTHLSLLGWRLQGKASLLVRSALCVRWVEIDAEMVKDLSAVGAWTGAWRGVEKVRIVGGGGEGLEREVRRGRGGVGRWFEVEVVEDREPE